MRQSMIKLLMFLLFVLFISTAACGAEGYWPADQWRTSTPERQGMDSEPIYRMLQSIDGKMINIHSVLIIRHGYLVAEAYFDPFDKNMKQPIYSCTKSIVSALYGIALKEGYLKSVSQKAYEFLKDEWPQNTNERKKEITIEHLLTMTSGINSPPSYQVAAQAEPTKYVLGSPMSNKPGEGFEYNGGTAHLLTGILKHATGINPLEYAQSMLFTPLGIDKVTWDADSQGVNLGGTGISLTPFQMSKFGYLYLRNGIWNGKQIVPHEWIKASTKRRIDTFTMIATEEVDGYGYLWWINPFGGYAAHGFGGQYIFVVPKSDLVVVFTSGLSDNDFSIPKHLMEMYIIPAIKSDQEIPADLNAQDALAKFIEKIKTQEAQPVGAFPETASQISGKTFSCEKNILNWKNFSLNFTSDHECLLKMTLDFAPQQVYEIPIGMDNRYRYTSLDDIGDSYVKGRWLDENTFEVTVVNSSNKIKITGVFEDGGVSVQVNDGTKFNAKPEN